MATTLADSLPRPLGFVLSGGSSQGAVQVGMLRALADAGVFPDIVVGTSVGAVNGAVIASDPATAPHRLEVIWRGLDRRDVFPGFLFEQVLTLARTRRHLFRNRGLVRLINKHVPVDRLEDLAVPFGAVATAVNTGDAVSLTDGPLVESLLASAAIPGVFPMVELGGRWLMDGGVAANVPIMQAREMGAESLVVLDTGSPCERMQRPRHITELLLYSSALLLRHQPEGDARRAGRELPVVYLPPPCPMRSSPFDFSTTGDSIALAHESSAAFLSTLAIDGPGVYGYGGTDPRPALPVGPELPRVDD